MYRYPRFVPLPEKGNRYAIGDIHGCINTFRVLVHEVLQLKPEDQLFLLGDYVNRGPDSLGVMSDIMNLGDLGYQVFPLKGNHEVMFLNDFRKRLKPRFITFIETLPPYYETDTHFLVHAGFELELEDPFSDTEAMIWGPRDYMRPPSSFLKGRQIACGHRVHPLSQIKHAIKSRQEILPLDNGCYKGLKKKAKDYGHLCALNLDTQKLLFQPNID